MPCLNVNARRVGALHVACALVCSVTAASDNYLRVTPEEVQWVYPQVVTYDVESNTDWEVE